MSNNFIFVKSETTNDKATKNPIWVSKPFEKTSYEPTSDEEKEWVSKDMKDQIMSTVSSLETKPLKDKDKIYIVLGVESQHIAYLAQHFLISNTLNKTLHDKTKQSETSV